MFDQFTISGTLEHIIINWICNENVHTYNEILNNWRENYQNMKSEGECSYLESWVGRIDSEKQALYVLL